MVRSVHYPRERTSASWWIGAMSLICSSIACTEPDTAASPRENGKAAEWVWHAVDGARCADGSPTGMGLSPATRGASRGLLVYFMGGGACWDHATCYEQAIASHLDGYDADDFEADIARIGNSGVFDRTDPDNPFRDHSFAFLPYCTGDVHAGLRVADHGGRPTHHVGYANTTAYLEDLREAFPKPQRVVVAGGSAGGFGAAFHWSRFVDAFAGVPVHLIDDSGPPLPRPFWPEARAEAWRSAWGLDEMLPPQCTECGDRLDLYLGWQAERHPSSRAAVLSYQHDPTTAFYLGISRDAVARGLDALVREMRGHDNVKLFVVPGERHTMLHDLDVREGDQTLGAWLQQMLAADPQWQTVVPAPAAR
jgi:hypothetical protein